MVNRLTDGLNFNAQALILRAERQRIIASNIANADTPGYVARDLNFAQALREATSNTAITGAPELKSSDLSGAATRARVEHNLVYATPSQTNLDNNTVGHGSRASLFCRERRLVRMHLALCERPGAHDAGRDEGHQRCLTGRMGAGSKPAGGSRAQARAHDEFVILPSLH